MLSTPGVYDMCPDLSLGHPPFYEEGKVYLSDPAVWRLIKIWKALRGYLKVSLSFVVLVSTGRAREFFARLDFSDDVMMCKVFCCSIV